MPDDSGTTARRSASGNAALLGAMLVVIAACCRASAGFTMLPGWESSPMDFVAPESNWTPMLSLGLDAVSLLGAMLCMTGTTGGSGPRSRLWMVAPIALPLGLASVAARLLLRDAGGASGSIDDLVLGSSWVASVGGMLGLMHACREAKCRGVALGTLIAFLVVLVGKGLLQTLVEQPATMQMFKQSREAFFASRGWSPDSPLARGFERRVMQTEASGWFGLANVFATFMAGGVTLGLATLVLAWRERAKARWAGLVLLIACGIGLVQCGSKGGFAVALLGGVFVVIAEWAGRGMRVLPRWLGPSLGVFAITSVIGGVIARGLIGERIGELSLLFRWFYMQGATRAFLESPVLGTGPAGFQEAYMRLKPPISPEDVASPHSVLFDWCATLGLGGIAWCVLLIAAAMVIGRGVIGAGRGVSDASLAPFPTSSPPGGGFEETPSSIDSMSMMKAVFLAAALATLFGAWCERLIVSPESAAVRFGGLIAWTSLGGVLAAWFARGGHTPIAAACAGGLALLAHMQMDVTSVNPMSAALVFAFIGAAAGAALMQDSPADTEPAHSNLRGFSLLAGGVMLLALALPTAGLVRVVPWENALRESAELAQSAGSLRMKLSEVRQSPTQEGIDALKRGLERALGRAVVARPEAIEAGLLELDNAAGTAAAARLKDAADREPAHVGTVSSLGQLQSRLAETLTRAGKTDEAMTMIADARKRATQLTVLRPRSINAWQWRTSIEAATSQVMGTDDNLPTMNDAYARCIELAPYSLAARVGMLETVERMKFGHGSEGTATEHAERVADLARDVLRVDDLLHLDPLIRLTTEQRRRIEALANVKTP